MAVVALHRCENPGWRGANALHVLSTPPAGRPRNGCAEYSGATRSILMMDILMLALGFAFFALAIGYTYACERL